VTPSTTIMPSDAMTASSTARMLRALDDDMRTSRLVWEEKIGTLIGVGVTAARGVSSRARAVQVYISVLRQAVADSMGSRGGGARCGATPACRRESGFAVSVQRR